MNNLTGNTNLLSTVGFKLILNSHEFKNTEFFAVSATLPGVTCSEAPAGFRNQAGYVPGEKLEFEPFNIRIAIDEDFKVYDEIFNWMYSFTTNAPPKVCDMTLCIMSSHNNVNRKFQFKNAFPTSLGSIEFNVQESDVVYAYTDVTFRYDYFGVDGLNFCP